MNKKALIDSVSKDTKLKKMDIAVILDGTLKVIRESVAKGDRVSFVGFGSFFSTKRGARNGRNPKTGKAIKIKEKRVPKFHAGKNLMNSVE